MEAFFGGTNSNVAPYRPTYAAGYVQDRLTLGAFTLELGLRVETFGSDASVPIDLFAPYPIARAGYTGLTNPADPLFQGEGFTVPGGIGSDYAVYFNDAGGVVGYRDLDGSFFDLRGHEADVQEITGSLAGQVEMIDAPRSTAFEKVPTHLVLSPRLGVHLDVTERARLFAYYNRLARRPAAVFYEPFTTYEVLTGQSGWVGNPRLEPEIVDDVGLGVQGEPLQGFSVRGTAFYRRHGDVIRREVLRGALPEYGTYRNGGTATVYGLDVVGALARTRGLSLRAGYVLAFAEADVMNTLGAGSAVGGIAGTAPSNADVRHALDVAAEYRIAEGAGPRIAGAAVFGGLRIGVLFFAQSGRPYTTLSSPGFSVTDPFTSDVADGINGARLPWVSQLDLRIKKRFRIGPGVLGAFVWVENVLGTQNVLAVYRATGEPDRDAFLDTPSGQVYIANQSSPASGTFNYLAYTGGPVNIGGAQSTGGPLFYGPPRRVRFGLRISL